jgi:hypothetical protein
MTASIQQEHIYAFFNGTLSQKVELECAYNNYRTKL